ncbi:F-box/kelch-repeat protein At3g06240-like [Rutidosis leptorrhynchoides]|uniref:F-box/kelch-repeat protein At3g06240-like n=1 Tax=Rutidosis leptorrhynchoides TaxID=125765 RepID=UPI003A9970E3
MTSEALVDVVEQILVKLDVKDLIRCKSVCKSWHSLISSDRFINYHLNRSYKNDLNNYAIGHRRILAPHTLLLELSMIGSSNGLVCIYQQFDGQLLVANPSTREVKKLPELRLDISECWGFGYDSSTKDYKIIVGFWRLKTTCFNLLSLKTNIWEVIRDVKYEPIMSVRGVLLDGSIHWLMINKNNSKKVILSFDLSREEFIEISLPDECDQYNMRLGVIKQCLCIFSLSPYSRKPEMKWVLKKYNAKKFWKRVPGDYGIKALYLPMYADMSQANHKTKKLWSALTQIRVVEADLAVKDNRALL